MVPAAISTLANNAGELNAIISLRSMPRIAIYKTVNPAAARPRQKMMSQATLETPLVKIPAELNTVAETTINSTPVARTDLSNV